MAKQPAAVKKREELLKENKALKKEVQSLKSRAANTNITKSRSFINWRSFTTGLCIILASVILLVGNLFFWLGNTYVNTNRYIATVGPLVEKPEIRSAIAEYTTTQIFANNNVQSYVQQVLPPKAVFLAPQLTTQLKAYTQSTLQTILANPKVQKIWINTLTVTHGKVINFSKSYTGNGTFYVSDIYGQLSKQLTNTKLSFLANKTLPAKVSSIKIADAWWLPPLHNLVAHISLYQAIATTLFIILVTVAIWLAKNRRKTAIKIGLLFFTIMIVTLLSMRIGRGLAINRVNSTYQSAIKVAYDTIFNSLVVQSVTIGLLALLLVLIAWISGPYKSTVAIKSRYSRFLGGDLHKSIVGEHENKVTNFVGRNRRTLQWVSLTAVVIIMLLVTLSPQVIALYALLVLILVTLIEIIGTPSKKKP